MRVDFRAVGVHRPAEGDHGLERQRDLPHHHILPHGTQKLLQVDARLHPGDAKEHFNALSVHGHFQTATEEDIKVSMFCSLITIY